MRRPWALAGLALLSTVSLATGAEAGEALTPLAPVEIFADGFKDLRGIAVDPHGTVFVADREAGAVTRIAPDRSHAVVATGLHHPVGLAVDAAGRLLIAEEGAGRVVRLEANGALTVVAGGIREPRWLVVADDGAVFIAARGLRRGAEQDADAGHGDSRHHDAILVLSPRGQLSVFADGFTHLQGLVLNHLALFAAARSLRDQLHAEGVVFQIPLLADGRAGAPVAFGPTAQATNPIGLTRDRLGALYLTADALDLLGADAHRVIAKLHPDGHLTRFASTLQAPRGLAFDLEGNLFLADGDAGRLLRFLGPPAPALAGFPEFTNRSPLPVAGTSEPRARMDLFVSDASTPVTVMADGAGAFSAAVPLAPNATNTLEVFATAHDGDGLTSPALQATVTHDNVAPTIAFHAPAANSFVRQTVTVEAQATDGGSGVATLALSADSQGLSATLAPPSPAPSITAAASWVTTAVPDGAHTLAAAATDRATNSASVSRVVIVDNTPPDTRITAGPAAEINVTDATFSFAGTDNLTPQANLVFAWRLDGAPFTAFTSSMIASFTGLAEGLHTFEVKARDLAGNEDPTPASQTFTVRLGPSITTVDPARGPGGTLVTITGTNFEPGATAVAFTGAGASTVAAVVRTVTVTQITTTVPIAATTGLLTVTTTRGSASQSFAVTTTGDFTLTAAPTTARVIAGDQTSVSLAAGGTGSFTSLVSLSVSTPSAGITTSFSPGQLVAPGSSVFVTLGLATTVAPGTYSVTVTGQAEVDGKTLSRMTSFTLDILAPATPAVTGRVLTAEALPHPIPNVTTTLGSAVALTDAGGNFVLLAPPPGPGMMRVDGRTASTPAASFPLVEVPMTVSASGPTRVPFTIFLPKIDTAHPIALPVDATAATTQEMKAATPLVPGLVVTIPAGTRIVDPEGNVVTQITITPVPIDRSPMPLPPGVTPPMLLSIQPGGAVPSQPLPMSFPNLQGAPPGTKADLYFFDVTAADWRIWGTGTVSADGTQIVSDPGFGLPRFAWHFAAVRVPFSDQVRTREAGRAQGGEPVDLPTGRFVVQKTDLVLPGRIPAVVQRTYRSENPVAGLFGTGWTLDPYDTTLTTIGASMSLVLPDQSTNLFAPTGPGRWANTAQTFLRGAVLSQLPGDFRFQLRFKDGTVQRFERVPGFGNLAALAAITDRNGNTVTITRGTALFDRRILQVTEPEGRSLTFAYDASGRITSVTDPIGRVVQYAYDPQGRLASVTDPAAGLTRYTYDASHRVLTITDPRGITFLINEYDAAGRVVRQTQADGGVWSFAYELTGNIVTQTTVTDPRGTAMVDRFNSEGFTLSQTDARGQTASFEHANGSNLLLATTDPLGRVTRFAYDAQGNVTTITDPAGNVRTFTYDTTFNRVTSITDPLGNVTSFTSDATGNLTAITDPLRAMTALAYNSFGQPTSTADPLGNTTTFTYDANGNLATVADPLGNTTTRAYDAVSRLTTQVDPRGKPTAFAYDPLNRITAITDALGGVTRFGYDGNGNLLTVTDPRGSTTSHTYDSMDRLASRTDPVGATESFAYDPAGNLVRHTDRKAQVSTFTYDPLNRRTGATYADATVTFAYDAAGRLVTATDSAGGRISNAYDALDRLVAQTQPLGTISYQHDALGRRTRMDAPGVAPVFYGYDAASRLTAITQAPLTPVAIAYDAAGRRTRLTLPNGVSTEYQYDAAAHLTTLVYRNAAGLLGGLNYQYDPAGNRASVGDSFARTLLPDPVHSASYDAANRPLTFGDSSMTYDTNGNPTSSAEVTGTTAFTWDARDRLTALATPSVTATFAYDADGRRRAKVLNGATTQYAYDGLDIIQEMGNAGPVSYLAGLATDQPLARNGAEFYLADALGSILALTDGTGALATRYAYAPFGQTLVDGAPSTNPFRYTGREHDGVADLYHYRLRYYSTSLHRFINEDPIGLLGGMNLYRYARNNPVLFTDPLGLDVTVTLYKGAVGNPFGHIGVGVNTKQTIGLYSVEDSIAMLKGHDVPGQLVPDKRDVITSIPIPTSPQQDRAVQQVIDRAIKNPAPVYNLLTNNCAIFVEHVLRAGGLQVPNTKFPRELMQQLQDTYGQGRFVPELPVLLP